MKTIIVTAGVIIEQGKILVTQRKEDSYQGLLWEFPGGEGEGGGRAERSLAKRAERGIGYRGGGGSDF